MWVLSTPRRLHFGNRLCITVVCLRLSFDPARRSLVSIGILHPGGAVPGAAEARRAGSRGERRWGDVANEHLVEGVDVAPEREAVLVAKVQHADEAQVNRQVLRAKHTNGTG
eukprot:1177243-Prorocentrum_minimum.AAC.2